LKNSPSNNEETVGMEFLGSSFTNSQ